MKGMDKYEVLGLVGEGSYGQVMKCRHKASGQLVAIKKFIETEEDLAARKMALREIRMLKRLQHDNLVNMIEVFRKKKRFHLVFEFIKETLLDKFEVEGGLTEAKTREYTFQVIRGLDFCHANNIVHRDLKPENVLVSEHDVIKLCDFGFARFITISQDPFTEYVATRWYRAPELLVGDVKYGRAVDIWALGCMMVEMLTSEPLFPGDSDIDQLYRITSVIGNLIGRHVQCLKARLDNGFLRDKAVSMDQLEHDEDDPKGYLALQRMYPYLEQKTLQLISACLKMEPTDRLKSDQLFTHVYFTWDKFPERFLPELQKKIILDNEMRPSVSKVPCPRYSESRGVAPSVICPKLTDWKIDGMDQSKVQMVDSEVTVISLGVRHPSLITLPECVSSKVSTESEQVEAEGTWSKLSSIPPLYARKREIEQLSVKEVEVIPSLLRSSKIMSKFRRDMLPDTVHILPVGGRITCTGAEKCRGILGKPTPRDFCLPELFGVDPKKRKQENLTGMFVSSEEITTCDHVTVHRTLSFCPICSPCSTKKKQNDSLSQ